MRFRVENLGPLREAEVDLGKKLIVLTGPNNTGKTYFSTAVYGFFRSGGTWNPGGAFPGEGTRFAVNLQEMMPFLVNATRTRAALLTSQLEQCFGVADKALAGARISVELEHEDARNRLQELSAESWGWAAGTGLGYVRRILPKADRIEFAMVPESLARDLRDDKAPWSDAEWGQLPLPEASADSEAVAEMRQRMVRPLFWEMLDRPSRLFPAERVAMSLFAREIAAARTQLAETLVNAPETAATVQRLGWPVSDAVSSALRLPEIAKRVGAFGDLADDLEREILGGTVSLSRYGVPTFTPHGSSASLDVQQSASMVKSLSSLVLYFRHEARRLHFLLIDEPELNLHADSQNKVGVFLARVVNRGFRALISTHSDYVLRELNMLLQLGRSDERAQPLVQEFGYPKDALLKPDGLGVYLFQNGTASAVEVSEEGFEVKTIDDEIVRANTLQQKIYSAFLD